MLRTQVGIKLQAVRTSQIGIQFEILCQFSFHTNPFQVLEKSMRKGVEKLLSRKQGLMYGSHKVAGRFYPQVGMKLQVIETYRTATVQFQGMRFHIQLKIQLPMIQVNTLRRQAMMEDFQSVYLRLTKQHHFLIFLLLRET